MRFFHSHLRFLFLLLLLIPFLSFSVFIFHPFFCPSFLFTHSFFFPLVPNQKKILFFYFRHLSPIFTLERLVCRGSEWLLFVFVAVVLVRFCYCSLLFFCGCCCCCCCAYDVFDFRFSSMNRNVIKTGARDFLKGEQQQ